MDDLALILAMPLIIDLNGGRANFFEKLIYWVTFPIWFLFHLFFDILNNLPVKNNSVLLNRKTPNKFKNIVK